MNLQWLNLFQLCKFLKFAGNLMAVVVLALLSLSYYSVIVLTLIPAIMDTTSLVLEVLYIALTILFTMVGVVEIARQDHSRIKTRAWKCCGVRRIVNSFVRLNTTLCQILIILIIWSYFAALVQSPGSVPEGWHPFGDDQVAHSEVQRWLAYGDTLYNLADPRRPRYCRKCDCWKPERAHHCSVSGKCILRMDHYCIWVVNCVGLLNYKFFLLFLAYTWLGCLMSLCILMPAIVRMIRDAEEHGAMLIFLTFIINSAFVLSLLGFLGMHLKLLSVNCTSIEMYEKQRINPWPYDNGLKQNLEEVLGANKWLWILPILTQQEQQRLLDLVLSPRLIETENQEP